MEQELEQFPQEVARLRVGRQRGGLPYPEAMRAFAVRNLEHALQAHQGDVAKVRNCALTLNNEEILPLGDMNPAYAGTLQARPATCLADERVAAD